MITALTNHLWQSTLFGALAGLLTLALRKNHARARYWLWLAASVKFLVPFALLVALGGHFGWRKTYVHQAGPLAIERFGSVFTPVISASIAPVVPHPISWIPTLLLALWCCGCAAVLLAWCVGWRRTARIIRTAERLTEGREVETLKRLQVPIEIVSSNARLEPGVFGILRPILFWPAGISQWLTDAQMDAILAHEMGHVHRRDNLAAAIHMLVEAVFWFHPVVWWIGARLVAERETACDHEVLRLERDPQVYAEGILKVCQYCLEAPLICISGVSGSDLKKRIQGIMAHDRGLGLGLARKLLLAVAGVAAIAVPIGIGIVNAPPSQAQSQVTGTPLPQFEVASIKPAAPDQRGQFIRPSPGGRLNINNMPLKELIVLAWRIQPFQVSGEPAWMESARYDISAKSEGNPKQGEIPLMLQSLLADRFQLKIHHESKELPVYALVVADKDGKLGSQLTESKEGSCTPNDPSKPPASPEPGKPFTMGCHGIMMGPGGLTVGGAPMSEVIPVLSRILGRTVVDRTGLKGNFDIRLNWTPDLGQFPPPPAGVPPGAPPIPEGDPSDPSIFTAMQEQLGLKLESTKGPVDIIVIDHVEKPSEN